MFIVYMAQSAYLLKDMVSDQTLWEWCYSGKSNTDTNVYNRLAEVIGNCFDCYDIYLQGSYRNSTSIDGNGDVDIVVECNGYYENAYISRHDLKHLRDDLFEAIQGITTLDSRKVRRLSNIQAHTFILQQILFRAYPTTIWVIVAYQSMTIVSIR